MMGFTHADAKELAIKVLNKNKTPAEEKEVRIALKRLTPIQKIWVSDEMSMIESQNKML